MINVRQMARRRGKRSIRRRKSKRGFKRRRSSKRIMRRRNRITVRKMPRLWPDKLLVKLPYVNTGITQLGVAGANLAFGYLQWPMTQIYNIGSAVAFNTNVAARPSNAIAGFQEYANMYTRFKVLGVKWNVRFTNVATTPRWVMTCPTTYSVIPANWQACLSFTDQPGSRHKLLSPAGSPGCTVRFTQYQSLKKWTATEEYTSGTQNVGLLPSAYTTATDLYSGGTNCVVLIPIMIQLFCTNSSVLNMGTGDIVYDMHATWYIEVSGREVEQS